jgi:hypothetical protein
MGNRQDGAHGFDSAAVAARLDGRDSIRWRPHVRVDKYSEDAVARTARLAGVLVPSSHVLERFARPFEVVEADGNLLTTAGLNRITSLIIAAGGQGATNTATRLGVGNSAAAEAVGQTDLQASAGSTNRWFQTMDATYPQQANGVLTFKSTFATGDGNFVWAEWCVDIGAPTVTSGNTVNANMLNRKVQALGTKAVGSWVLTATITLS